MRVRTNYNLRKDGGDARQAVLPRARRRRLAKGRVCTVFHESGSREGKGKVKAGGGRKPRDKVLERLIRAQTPRIQLDLTFLPACRSGPAVTGSTYNPLIFLLHRAGDSTIADVRSAGAGRRSTQVWACRTYVE